MKQDINEIEINGIKYIKKDSVPTSKLSIGDNYVVIRSTNAGVHVGELVSQKDTYHSKEVLLKNTRRIYYWSGAASLSQLAYEGVKNPNNCKFTVEIPRNTIIGVIEIIPCTVQAAKNIRGVPVWKK